MRCRVQTRDDLLSGPLLGLKLQGEAPTSRTGYWVSITRRPSNNLKEIIMMSIYMNVFGIVLFGIAVLLFSFGLLSPGIDKDTKSFLYSVGWGLNIFGFISLVLSCI